MAPTLATACAALYMLVPEALALRAVPMCAGTSGAAALSPEGAIFPRGGPSEDVAPTLATSCAALPLEGANFPRGGPSGNCVYWVTYRPGTIYK